MYTQVCEEKASGTKQIVRYGFPADYVQKVEFSPHDSSKAGLIQLNGDKNYGLILVNILFWMAALTAVLNLLTKIKSKR